MKRILSNLIIYKQNVRILKNYIYMKEFKEHFRIMYNKKMNRITVSLYHHFTIIIFL